MPDITEVAGQIEQYVDIVCSWDGNHQGQTACDKVGETVDLAIRIYDAIVAFDEDWRRRVMRGELRFSCALHSFILRLFRRWHAPCDDVLAAIENLQAQGLFVTGALEFKNRCREAAGITTSDAESFAIGQLIHVRDEVPGQHQCRETLEHGPG
jgi:hypothetical protein